MCSMTVTSKIVYKSICQKFPPDIFYIDSRRKSPNLLFWKEATIYEVYFDH